MAHRTNMTPVKENFSSPETGEMVTDPICQMKMKKKDAKFMLFRESGTFYFCSKDCQSEFISPKKKPAKEKRAA